MKNITPQEKTHLKKMFTLNWISNLNANYAAEHEEDLEKNIQKIQNCLDNDKVQGIIGGKWNVVWGPATGNTEYTRTYKEPTGDVKTIKRWATDNAMYVAQKEGTQEYFVGISGTNGISLKGWFEQDFDVEKSIAWPPEYLNLNNTIVKGKPRISKAASVGLKAILELKPIKAGKESESKKTIIEFLLDEIKNSNSSISIGGHSLGGCLTPLLATAIADKMRELDQETQEEKKYVNVTINAYPTAGPTPGNQDFANHLQARVDKYHSVYNQNDLVPLAWNFNGLNTLTKTYKKWKFSILKIRPDTAINVRFLHWASNFARDQKYTHEPSEISPDFQVTTWANNLISKIESKNETVKGYKIDNLIAAVAGVMICTAPNKWLKKINNGALFYSMNVNRFIRFLLQVSLQHVTAYTNPTSDAKPWEFTVEEKKALQLLFSRTKPTEATNNWAVATGIVMMAKLAEKAASWLSGNTDKLTSIIAENQFDEATEIDENNIAIPETEDAAMAILEKLSKESPELTDALAFIGNPYGQMF